MSEKYFIDYVFCIDNNEVGYIVDLKNIVVIVNKRISKTVILMDVRK